ncbi:MAG: ATP synthase F1 subunit gamma, partial [Clostridia bacterium]|nr:ATP synthase F1 subunit gamma [Clostridia bacterium]
MSGIAEIKGRMESIREMQKITNAMYLIACAKLQHAKAELNATRPYFDALASEIKRVFRIEGKIENKYFYPLTGEHEFEGAYGYLVITADKGLAGAYNQNVIKKVLELTKQHDESKLFVVGEYGRQYFESHHIPIEKSFIYTAQNPTLHRARKMSRMLLDMYDSGELKKIFVVYTDFGGGMKTEVNTFRLLPFHRKDFGAEETAEVGNFEFLHSLDKVLDNIMPSYITGYIYSALIDSFCSEQGSRMSAMNNANENTKELLSDLRFRYNHTRQDMITREITEIAAASRNQAAREAK